MKPEISIIIANYNNARFLDDCLTSVITQSFDNFECIVIDDGSTDNSAAIIRKYARRDKRIKPIFQKNAGASAARNRGIDAARGRYIGFLDADDCYCPDALMLLYNLISQNNAQIAGGGGVLVPHDFKLNTAKNSNIINPPFTVYGNGPAAFKAMSQLGPDYRLVWIWRRLFSREVIGDIRFEEDLFPGEDTCFMLEVLPRAIRIVETKSMVVYHRVSDAAVSGTPFNQKRFGWIPQTMRQIRRIMDEKYDKSIWPFFYRLYLDIILLETIVPAMKYKRMMFQVADLLRPIYGTRVLPTKYLPLRKRLVFWLFMKVF